MSATKFFVYPFGVAGTLTAVPDPTQISGSVSYQQGFGIDYTLEYGVDPAALPIPQGGMNQLFFDITTALQQYQTIGAPNFVTTAQNLGTPYPYLINAYALWTDGNIYQALTNNSVTPADPTKWRLCDNNAAKIILPNRVFEGTVVSGNMVYWNAGTSQFTKAIANGTGAQLVVGIADTTNLRVYVSGDVAIMSGLTPGSQYYLSTITPGAITAIAPSFSAIPIGVAISSTELLLSINTPSPTANNRYVGASMNMIAGTGVPQTVTAVAPTIVAVNFNTVVFDPYTISTPGVGGYITIPFTGYWRVEAGVSFSNQSGVVSNISMGVIKNFGTTYLSRLGEDTNIPIGASSEISGSNTFSFSIGDIVQIAVSVGNSSFNVPETSIQPYQTFFTVTYQGN